MQDNQLDPIESTPQARGEREASGADEIASVGRQLAGRQVVATRPKSVPTFDARLQALDKILRDCYHYYVQASETQLTLSYAAEWLLDNFYVVQQTIRQVREDMPSGYHRQLPKLGSPPLEGHPRVYSLAVELTRYCTGTFHLDAVMRFVRAYQTVAPLTMGELWALPTMLRLRVLELMAQALTSITGLGDDRREVAPTVRSVSPMPDDEATVADSILCLRALATQDWNAFFESVSQVERILATDPAGTYARMDFDTRDRYRGIVEGLALATGRSEGAVARSAIKLAQDELRMSQTPGRRAGHELPRGSHVGYHLMGEGRARLEARLAYLPSLKERLRRLVLARPLLTYLGSSGLVAGAILFGLLFYAWTSEGHLVKLIGVGLLACLPAAAMAISVVNWLATHLIPPRVLPRLDFAEGIPDECPTMVAVPVILNDIDRARRLIRRIELHYLGNPDPNLHFALLTDFADGPRKVMPGDNILLDRLEVGVRGLNRKYRQGGGAAQPFYLFHRERLWNPGEECWMGWERKRGKLVEFNSLVCGSENTTFAVQVGDLDLLPTIKYVITVDADTILPRGTALRLVATIAHPLNRAEIDPETGVVIDGYSILQPRVEISPTSANRSLFTRIFSGDVGLDLYTRAVSDVYQDVFGEGIYVGKGIYDVAAFEASLAGRVPDNALLSHDLFEGIHGRAGLVTDVVLFEDYPPNYIVQARRMHRWVRGDWQLWPWLLPRAPGVGGGTIRNTLSALDRWKILDNLRRSLLMPAVLILLVLGWLWLPGSAGVWTLVGILSLALPLFMGIVTGLTRRFRRPSFGSVGRFARMDAVRWMLALVFLPFESLIVLDAIATTLVRTLITRKRRLQWTTAAHTIRLFGRERKVALVWRQMGGAPILAFAIAVLVAVRNPGKWPSAAPLLVIWLVSPGIAALISHAGVRGRSPLSSNQTLQLRRVARRTWLFFQRFVGPEDHWLPPDHFQETPRGLVAHRTSPTNLGLLLLSTMAAYDVGYIGPVALAFRLRDHLENMGRLERHRGHFLNWYNTASLEPLPPRYVSTVDSGNLAACLVALKQGLLGVPREPVIARQRWLGLLDTLAVLQGIVEGLPEEGLGSEIASMGDQLSCARQRVMQAPGDAVGWASLFVELRDEVWPAFERMLISFVGKGARSLDIATLASVRIWSEQFRDDLLAVQLELDVLLPWLLSLQQAPGLFARQKLDPAIAEAWRALLDAVAIVPRLDAVAQVCRKGRSTLDHLHQLLTNRTDSIHPAPADEIVEARAWCEQLAGELEAGQMNAEALLISYHDLSRQAETAFREMDFRFLFDPQRQVFHIGYNVESGNLDANHYDLLASESRIASLLAIAKRDVPTSHWLHLSRPLAQVEGMRTLLSWSGTMFEYLMPDLVMRSYRGTLLTQSSAAAVDRQIAYARQKGVPWGVSESGYFGFDANQNYQYRAFGVPGLGLRRGLSDDLVVAPYASLLALHLRPHAVMKNVQRVTELRALGDYGLYEAIDYTRARIPPGQKHAIVRSYMAHHQGMALLSMANYLCDGIMINRFHSDPLVQSVELLLQEQVPLHVPIEDLRVADVGIARVPQQLATLTPWRVHPRPPLPQVHVLSNGRYGVHITSAGAGYSTWQGVDLTRWRADLACEGHGTWVYVQDADSGEILNVSFRPGLSSPESQAVFFFAHKVELRRQDQGIALRMNVTVPPDDDVEVRRISLTNQADRPRRLVLTTYSEVVLAEQSNDRRHPAFSKLFIESEHVPEVNGLLFRRRPRSREEPNVHMVHLLVTEEGQGVTGAHEADRARFLGRGGSASSPAALTSRSTTSLPGLSGTTGATLDPVMVLGQEIDLRAHSTVQLAVITLAAESRRDALALASRYQSWVVVDRAFDLARASSELELRRLDLGPSEIEPIQKLLSALLYPFPALRASPSTLAANQKGQSGLWQYAISGDYPILLVRIGSLQQASLVRDVLQAHAYWRDRRIMIDLVILNEKESGYEQELHDQLYSIISRAGADNWLNRRGGVFLLRADQLSEPDRVLLATAARVILDGERGALEAQSRSLDVQPTRLPAFVPMLDSAAVLDALEPPLLRPADLLFDNGLGGFTGDGREYVIHLEPGQWTPAPWINVVAGPDFGFLVSETGLGCTWAGNSGENRLTPWRNDPVTDLPSEALYLRDEETGSVWSPTPLPARASAPYQVRHGAGYSVFDHHSHGLVQQLRVFAVPGSSLKVIHLRLHNTGQRNRRITATYYAEWVLGTDRDAVQQYVVSEFDAISNALLARNPYGTDFAGQVAFLAASREPHGLTADRTEFIGRGGDLGRPAALDRVGLTGTVRAGLDPCAAIQVLVWLAPG